MQLPARVVDVAVRAHEQRRLPLGVALADHVVHARDGRGIGARAGQQAVARDDLVDRPGELDVRPSRGSRGGRRRARGRRRCATRARRSCPSRRPPPSRVCRNSRRASGSSEATGSSSSSSSGPLRERERERDLRLLAARELADLLAERQAERARCARSASASSQLGLSLRPSFSVSAIVKPGRAGAPARRSRRAAARARGVARAATWPRTRTVAGARLRQADGELQQRRLAGAVRADERRDRAGRDLERAVAQRPVRAVALAEPVASSASARSCHPRTTAGGRTRVGEQRGDVVLVEARGRARSSIQRCSDVRSAFTSSGGSGGGVGARRTSPARAAPRRAPRGRARGRP